MLIKCNECSKVFDSEEWKCPHCGCSTRYWKSVTIDSSVSEIKNGSFRRWIEVVEPYGLYGTLKEIIIPNSVKTIKANAFEDCTALENINIPSSVTEIGEHAFFGCRSLKSITIPSSVRTIGSLAFDGCESLENVFIPDSVAEIGEHAFWNCKSLKAVIIPDSITVIRRGTFSGCSSLKNIILPNSITSIEQDAFFKCKSLESITIPNSVINIDSYEDYDGHNSPFYGCISLRTVIAPAKFKKEFDKDVTFISSLDNSNTQNFNSHREAPDGWGDLNPYGLEGNDYEAWLDSLD